LAFQARSKFVRENAMDSANMRRSALALAAASILSVSAHAALFRSYVSADGDDARPCTLAEPCRLLPAALAAVADGGEIWMLDSANYNAAQLDIAKSVTILAVPGAVGSVVATGGGDAIRIDAPAVKVALRNLVIVALGSGHYGVNFVQGAELDVAQCEIANMTIGIFAMAGSSKVTVRNTVLRGLATGVYVVGTVVASLDGVHSKGNTNGVTAFPSSRTTISNSVFSGHAFAVSATGGGGTARVAVERSVLTGNSYGIYAQANSAGDFAQVTASGNTLVHNSAAAFYAVQGASSNVTVVVDNNSVVENGIGFWFSGAPTIYTRGNNTLMFNGSDLSGGSLTTLAGQ
jgi:hypothetical protein